MRRNLRTINRYLYTTPINCSFIVLKDVLRYNIFSISATFLKTPFNLITGISTLKNNIGSSVFMRKNDCFFVTVDGIYIFETLALGGAWHIGLMHVTKRAPLQ